MSKIIKCKNYNAEIPSNAEVCVSCGVKNKKPIFKKVWFWILIVILIVVIGSCSGGSDTTTNTNTTPNTTDVEIQDPAYAIGDVITTKKFEIVIDAVDTKNSVGSQYFNQSPADGGVYVVVNYHYKNISSEPISSFSCPTIHIKDANDIKYDADITATSYYATEANLNDKVLSDLNPGITVKNAQVFEISEELYNAGGFSVLINADKDINVPIN